VSIWVRLSTFRLRVVLLLLLRSTVVMWHWLVRLVVPRTRWSLMTATY